MTGRCVFLYFVVLTIPFFLGVTAWQSTRYAVLEQSVRTLEAAQEKQVENNKRLIAAIAVLSSAERIGTVALRDLGLSKIQPENVLQIRIEKR